MSHKPFDKRMYPTKQASFFGNPKLKLADNSECEIVHRQRAETSLNWPGCSISRLPFLITPKHCNTKLKLTKLTPVVQLSANGRN
jgi:hypothetical protein